MVGQTVTFTATIGSSASGETGTVQFADNGTPIGSGTVSGGQATLQTSSLSLGTHPITAVYEGDTNFVGSSTATALSQVVNQAPTSTALISDHNPGTVGQTITYTATVTVNSPGSGAPGGSVSFSDGGTPIGTCQGVGLTASSPFQATCPQTYATNASHSITATYSGDPDFSGSTGGPYTENLSQVSTTTSVLAAPSSGTYGQPVTLTATVAPTSGTANPTGSVTFTDNGTTTLGSSTLSTTAGVTTASILVTTLPVGTDLVSASYGGGSGFLGSATTTSASVTVSMAPTTLGLLSSMNPSTFGQSVTFTATVFPGTGSGETGIVTFFDNGGSIGSGSVSNGQATLTTSTLAIGTHPITATYAGDTNFVGSSTTTTISQVVNKAPTSLSLGSSVNPSTSGQSVTFTATIHPTTGSGETGTITFFDNGTPIGTGGVSGGTATLTTSTLGVGSHPITATYGGDGNFVGSSTASALSQVVNSSIVSTTTSLSSTINPSTVSQTPTLTAVVTPTGGNNFTGTVTFFEGATTLGTSPIAARGEASINLPQLASAYAIGTHSFTATYSGDSNYVGSTSSPFSQVVAPPIFVSGSDGNAFSIVNSATNAVVNGLASAGTGPGCTCTGADFLAVSPDGTRVYLMQPTMTSTLIYVVNTTTDGVINVFSLKARGLDLTISPNGSDLFVAESAPAEEVAEISTATGAVVSNFGASFFGLVPQAVAVNPAGTVVAFTLGSEVETLDLATPYINHFFPINGADSLAFSPDGSTLYVTNGLLSGGLGADTVTSISMLTNTVTRSFGGMTDPTAIAVTPDGTQLFVANASASASYVSVISLPSGTTTNLPQSTVPRNVSVSPDGASVYVANYTLGQVSILNASSHAIMGTIGCCTGSPDTVKAFDSPAALPPPPPPLVISTSLPQAAQNVYYQVPISVSNGLPPYTFKLTGGSLPAGMILQPSGIISGTPTSTATTSTFTIMVSDSYYPPATATATLTLNVLAASTGPPPCGSTATQGFYVIPAPNNCASGSNFTPGGTATATSSGPQGTVSVTAHGTGGLTVGQFGQGPPGGVPFRAAANSFDLQLSTTNTFSSVTVVDCALGGATTMQWWNPAANSGLGAFQTVSPETYNRFTRCLTIALSATSSPTLAQMTGTLFAGVLPGETVSLTVGGANPYSVSGQVVSGAIAITPGLITKVSGTVSLQNASGAQVPVAINVSCVLGVCLGTFAAADPVSGVTFTTPVTATVGQVNANQAGGQGLVFPGPGLKNAYPLSWSVTISAT